MTVRTLLTIIFIIMIGALIGGAEDTMNIKLRSGETHIYNISDIDSITFGQEDPGLEREFELGNTGEMITMVWIPPGEFMMGAQENEQDADNDEFPLHQVTFERGFWMGKYEITQAQWQAVMHNNPANGYGVGDNYPVYNVRWNDIQNFESAVNNDFRLPSEAEWEYACRAGTSSRFYWGDDPQYSNITNYAIYNGNNNGRTEEVGNKLPNDWELYDMSGNVWEWCEDWYHGQPPNGSYNGAPNDGSAWITGGGSYRLQRGGGWHDGASLFRSASRHCGEPTDASYVIGFRLVRNSD